MACAAALAVLAAVPGHAQDEARVNWVDVHSPSIEGNLEHIERASSITMAPWR